MPAAEISLKNNRLKSLKIESFNFYSGGKIDIQSAVFSASSVIDKLNREIVVHLSYSADAFIAESKVFSLAAEHEGVFVYSESSGQEDVAGFAKANAPAIVYPLLRSVLAMSTLSAGFPPLTLPVVNFHQVRVNVSEKK